MLPPPMTIATCTPSPATSPTSAAGAGSPRHLPRLAHLEPGEPLDDDPFAGLGVHAVHEVADLGLAGGVLDERLLEQALLGEELLQFALDDLVDDLRRLLLVGHLAAVDFPFLLDDLARNVFTRHVGGIRGGDLHA